MRLYHYGLLTDVNIHPEVVQLLRHSGWDVWDAVEAGHSRTSDEDLALLTQELDRVLITHDSDFGAMTTLDHPVYPGVIHLRPGHLSSAITIESLQKLFLQDPDLEPPFLVVVKRTPTVIQI
ncbi:MAG: DUF5615 family PIN-like protein [Gemmataceae bacterium]